MSEIGDEVEDYYAAVERHFVSLRGSPLFVSPAEWQLIHRWREAQIPLRVVKQGLDQAFANRKPHRPIRRLSYCRQTVEATYRRFREAVAGAGSGAPRSYEQAVGSNEVPRYLEQLIGKLETVRQGLEDSHAALDDATERAITRLKTLNEPTDEPIGLEALERELRALENELFEAAESALGSEDRAACREAAERSLADYRGRMPAEVHESALRSAYLKRVRARFDLPPISLFYL